MCVGVSDSHTEYLPSKLKFILIIDILNTDADIDIYIYIYIYNNDKYGIYNYIYINIFNS